MQYYGDYHTHSDNSDGRQKVDDIVSAARKRGFKEIAITDHGPLAAVIGVKSADTYLHIKDEIAAWNSGEDDIRVLVGAEANIRDCNGTLDIPPEVVEQLDILIAGLHPYTLPTTLADGLQIWVQNSLRHLGKAQKDKAVNANTKACVGAVYNNPEIDILAHPGLFFTVDTFEVAQACASNEVLFEINCGHKYPAIFDIMEAEKTGVEFIVNSDAHFSSTVGDLAYGTHVISTLSLDPGRIANSQSRGGITRWGKKNKVYTS